MKGRSFAMPRHRLLGIASCTLSLLLVLWPHFGICMRQRGHQKLIPNARLDRLNNDIAPERSHGVMQLHSKCPMCALAADTVFRAALDEFRADGIDLSPVVDTWRDCSAGFYIDIGSNVGVQVRKLYHPDQFRQAPVLPLFDQHFGAQRSKVCVLSIEPNPAHTKYLQTLATFLQDKGHPAVFLTDTAAAAHAGVATFHHDSNAQAHDHQWMASLHRSVTYQGNVTGASPVPLLDVSKFWKRVMRPAIMMAQATRGTKPPVVVKLDIEGSEFEVFPSMAVEGVLCDMDLMMIEWHDRSVNRAQLPAQVSNMTAQDHMSLFEKLRALSPGCTVVMSQLDDETYRDGMSIPLF